MLETMNDFIGLGTIVFIIVVFGIGLWSFSAKAKRRDESEDYYRDLL